MAPPRRRTPPRRWRPTWRTGGAAKEHSVAFAQLLRALVSDAGVDAGQAFRAFLGADRTRTVLASGERPEGAVAANALARFTLKIPGEE